MVLLAGEDHHALGDVGVAEAPLHVELGRHRLEGGGQLRRPEAGRQAVGHDLDAQEEAPRVEVPVLGRFEDRAAVAGDQAGDGGDDADPVGAGDGQDVSTHGRRPAYGVTVSRGRVRPRGEMSGTQDRAPHRPLEQCPGSATPASYMDL